MFLADLVVIAIILLSLFIGVKRGFIRSIVGVLSIVISLALATWTYPVVSNTIDNIGITSSIEDTIEKSLINKDNSEKQNTEDEISHLPKSTQEVIQKQTEAITASAADATAKTISSLAVNIISILLVFIIVRIIMFLISHSLKFITRLPVIKGIDKILGGILGLLSGILIVYLILTFITFNTAINSDGALIKAIHNSYLTSFMYDNNFIVNLLT